MPSETHRASGVKPSLSVSSKENVPTNAPAAAAAGGGATFFFPAAADAGAEEAPAAACFEVASRISFRCGLLYLAAAWSALRRAVRGPCQGCDFSACENAVALGMMRQQQHGFEVNNH